MYGNRSRTGLIVILVIIFLLIGGVAIYALMTFGSGANANQSNSQAQAPVATKPSTTKIIIAAHDIRRGTRLTEEDVTTMDWPIMAEAPLPLDAITVGETADQPGLEQVKDRAA